MLHFLHLGRFAARLGIVLAVAMTLARGEWLPAQESPSGAAAERLILLDGSAVEGTVVAIDPAGKIALDKATAGPLELDGLRSIERSAASVPEPAKDTSPAGVIELVGGGQITARQMTIADERCRVRWALGDELSLSLEDLRAVRFGAEPVDPAFAAAVAGPGQDQDRLYLKVEDRLEAIAGLVQSIDEEKVVFELADQTRTIPRAQVYGLVVAVIGRPPELAGLCRAHLADGSAIWGRVLELAGGTLTLQTPAKTKLSLPWSSVARLEVRSTRLSWLSDLEPVQAQSQPVVTLARPWQRDRSVEGRPLTLGERTFAKGLGVASRSLLTFEAGGQYQRFAATIGIDAETAGRGDCVFVVLGDDRQLFRQRVEGSEPPREVSLDVSGVRRLSLVVEPGEDLDLADHADWCDARLIRQGK